MTENNPVDELEALRAQAAQLPTDNHCYIDSLKKIQRLPAVENVTVDCVTAFAATAPDAEHGS
jgi:hypothetical protein